jgi:hypothetical protein
VYLKIARFLNTTETTSMGPGAGLEAGNTIYFDTPADRFAYWNTDDCGREMICALIRSGHIDCLHSYGDLATTREHAGRALDELSKRDCRLEVWIDHAVAPTNFGADIMRGQGDVPGAPAYHADLTCAHGVCYVWRGRVTSVIGQDVPRSLGGVFDAAHALAASRTLLKEAIKGTLGRRGSEKYRMHAANDLLRRARLRDGSDVIEFVRCNPHWGGVSSGETARGLGEVLSAAFLERLVEREGACILYTHLGKGRDRHEPLPGPTREALHRLARFQREGRILVTTTRRLLGYRRAVRETKVSFVMEGDHLRVRIRTDHPAAPSSSAVADWNGLTVDVPDHRTASLEWNGTSVTSFTRNPPDSRAGASVSLPWPRLEFPLR